MAKMPTTDTDIQSSVAERIDHLREAVGWKRLTPAEVAERCEKIVAALRAALGEKLVAVALYGSWARGDAEEGSDIDLLIIACDLPDHPLERRKFLHHIVSDISPRTDFSAYSPEGFDGQFQSLYLDFGLDAKPLYDPTGYLTQRLERVRAIIEEAGLYREQKGKDLYWHWRNPPQPGKWSITWEGYDDGTGRRQLSAASRQASVDNGGA
jgi:hypothetical protein